MAKEYDPEHIQELAALIDQADLHYCRPPGRYEPGKLLHLKVRGVCPAIEGKATLRVECFAGGGFAGQVYRVRVIDLDPPDLNATGLKIRGSYAVKIHVPPSRFSRLFRDAIYWLGFQGPFAAQVNENAARTGALWQKLIRRGGGSRFCNECSVADIHATFFDPEMRSFGEIIEWVDGRIWRLEIDREVFCRRKVSANGSRGSSEYLAKKEFMEKFVNLLHDMGAPELARQYEWGTGKSQPNVFKRLNADSRPEDGLTALDFRPGLALLFFLPMSPADCRLIREGCRRGSLVQFDRCDLGKLRRFCSEHAADFQDLIPVLEELESAETRYRNSLPDVTHHGFRLLYDKRLRQEVKTGLIEGWHCLGLVDEPHARRLKDSTPAFRLFYLAGGVPLLGGKIRLLWGNPNYRKHLLACFGSLYYFRRVLRAGQAECLINWHRSGRVGESGTGFFLRHPLIFALARVLPGMLPLPAKLHRALIDWRYALEKAKASIVFPIRFYCDPDFRTNWLTCEVEEGVRQGILKPKEKERILAQISDPFIQKYLKCLAVHFCTFPITKVAMILIAIYAYLNFGSGWEQSLAYAIAAMVLVGILPISPGSLVRGSYVVYLMIRERNLRNYWLAALVSYWHYVGYLGFPLQMAKEFPTLARLISSRWVTGAVKVIPVFGESGALLEHMAFDLCVNIPLSIKRKIQKG